MLYLIGLGTQDLSNITIHGLNVIKDCRKIFLIRSSLFNFDQASLETLLNRSVVTISAEELLSHQGEFFSSDGSNAILVYGDPFHRNIYPQLKLAAHEKGIPIKVIHNSSVLNRIGCSGLQLYRFGESFSITSPFDGSVMAKLVEKIDKNLQKDLHTFIYFDCLKSGLHCRFAEYLLLNAEKFPLIKSDMKCIVVESGDATNILHCSLRGLCEFKEKYVSSLAVCASLHPLEEDALNRLQNTCNTSPKVNENTFHLIGLGLGEPEDVTLAGKEAISKSGAVFLEGYTSIMIGGKEELERFFGREIVVADREMVEQGSDEILDRLQDGDVAFLVVGDPLGATTHVDLLLRAIDKNFRTNILNNASIINAIGICGLNPDLFGEVVSIPFWDDVFKPESFYDKICSNLEDGLHTLCLLDIKVKEQSIENLMKGRKIYEPPRFMSVQTAAHQLLQIIENKTLSETEIILNKNTNVIGLARIGTNTQIIKFTSLENMSCIDLGSPLHSLIIASNLDDIEEKLNNLT